MWHDCLFAIHDFSFGVLFRLVWSGGLQKRVNFFSRRPTMLPNIQTSCSIHHHFDPVASRCSAPLWSFELSMSLVGSEL